MRGQCSCRFTLRLLCLLQIQERRTNMPLTQQKRYDLYALVDKELPET